MFYSFADIAKTDVFGIDLLKITARVFQVSIGLIGRRQLIPNAVFFFFAEARSIQRPLIPLEREIRHRFLHETMSEQNRTLEEPAANIATLDKSGSILKLSDGLVEQTHLLVGDH